MSADPRPEPRAFRPLRPERLPGELRNRLLSIPDVEARGEAEPFPPLDVEPLPSTLRARLLTIPQLASLADDVPADAEGVPSFVRSSRLAVAASYLVAAMLFLAVGNPVAWGRERLEHLGTQSRGGLAIERLGALGDLRSSQTGRVGRVLVGRVLASTEATSTEVLDGLRAGWEEAETRLREARTLLGDEAEASRSKSTDPPTPSRQPSDPDPSSSEDSP